MQFIDQRPCPRLSDAQPEIGRLATHFFFDAIEGSDAGQRFGCGRRWVDGVDVMELTPSMCPACDFLDGAVAVEMMKSGIGIGLQRALEFFRCCLGCSPLRSFE